jgi:hypothetical protein
MNSPRFGTIQVALRPINGIFDIIDSVASFIQPVTDVYNAFSPVLDPWRDQLVQSVISPSTPKAPVNQYQPTYQTQSAAYQNPTPPKQAEQPFPIVPVVIASVGGLITIVSLTLLLAGDDSKTKKTR